MDHHPTPSRAEAERLLGISEKLLLNKDLSGCKDFAILSQEMEPLLEGSDQILAVSEVLLAAEKRVNNKNHDWYSILQIPNQRNQDSDLIKKQYRRLALLLHPDKNKFPFAESAFRIVADAWAVLSDPAKKSMYDGEYSRFSKVDLKQQQQQQKFPQQKKSQTTGEVKLPVRRSGTGGATKTGKKNNPIGGESRVSGNFWTTCPYCYNLYEYPRVYEGCCLRCDNKDCGRAMTATEILSLPPLVPGKEAYYCCWGFFPLGFVPGNVQGGNGFFGAGNVQEGNGFPPPIYDDVVDEEPVAAAEAEPVEEYSAPPPVNLTSPVSATATTAGTKRRGRPRKN